MVQFHRGQGCEGRVSTSIGVQPSTIPHTWTASSPAPQRSIFRKDLASRVHSQVWLEWVVGVLLWRIFDQEMFMRQAFGDEWDAYARRTWRLIPFVYGWAWQTRENSPQ